MTQPDEEHRVVYRAVADFAELMVQARAAREEMRRLKADVQSVGGTVRVDVQVRADTVNARAEILRVLGGIVAKIRVAVDLPAARAEVARVFGQITARVRLDLDVTAARQRVRTALSNVAARMDVSLQTGGVLAQMRALITRLQAMGPVRLRVVLDPQIFRDVSSLGQRLAQLRGALGSISGGGGGGPGAVASALGAALQIPALIAALGLAIPLLAAAAGGVGVLVAAVMAAGAPLAAFATAAIGSFTDLKTAMEAAAETGQPVMGALGAVAAVVNEVRGAYREFLADTQGPVLEAFVAALRLVLDLLPQLVGLTNATAQAVTASMGEVSDELNGAGFAEFLDFLQRNAPAAIGAFTRALLDITAGLGLLTEDFEPFIQSFLSGMTDMTAAFRQWAGSLQGSPEFAEFMGYVMRVGPKVVDTVIELIRALVNIGVALAPLGELVLDVTQAVASMIAGMDPETILAMVVAVGALATAFKIGVAAVAAWNVIVALAARAGLTGLTVGVLGLARGVHTLPTLFALAVGAMRTWIATASAARLAVAGGLVGALVVGTAALIAFISRTRDAARESREYKQATQELAEALERSGGQITPEVRRQTVERLERTTVEKRFNLFGPDITSNVLEQADRAGIALEQLSAGAEGNRKAYNDALAAWDAYIQRLQSQRAEAEKNFARGDEAAQLGNDIELAERAREAYTKIAPRIEDVRAQQDRRARATGSAAKAQEKDNAATEESLAQQQRQAELLTAALDAHTAAAEAVEAHAEAVRRQGEVAEEAAEANRRANEQVIDSERAHAEAMRNTQRAQEALNQARIDARERLQDLARELRDLPLDEEQARIALQRAEEALARGRNDPGTSALDLRQLEIDVQRARNALADQLDEGGDSRRDASRDLRRGIEGSDEVKEAQERLAEARKNEAEALDRIREAERERDRVFRRGKRSIEEARDATEELGEKAAAARVELDKAGHSAGFTAGQLEVIAEKQKAINAELPMTLRLFDPDDAENRLRTIAQYKEALRLIGVNPALTVDEALRQAAANMAAANTTAYRRQLPQDLGGGEQDPGPNRPRRAAGGPIWGPGTGTSDDVDAKLSVGEHVWTALEVAMAGGHLAMEWMRRQVRSGWAPWLATGARGFAGGGAVLPAQRAGSGAGVSGLGAVPRFAVGGAVAPVLPRLAGGGSAGTAVRAVTAAGGRGVSIGDITVINPVPEPAGESVYRTVRRMVYEWDD